MFGRLFVRAAAMLWLASIAFSAQAVMYADDVTSLFRGAANLAEFPGFYGGTFPGTSPVAIATNAEVTSAVVGAPDGRFVSLPGDEANNPTQSGSAFQWAYVEVSFPTSFGANSQLLIRELGANAEQAHLFIWFQDGGNVQLVKTRPATGDFSDLVVDLSPYAGLVAAHGGSFTRVGIGGLDLGGASKGFDLDSVGVQQVPEPADWAFLSLGLLATFLVARGKSVQRTV